MPHRTLKYIINWARDFKRSRLWDIGEVRNIRAQLLNAQYTAAEWPTIAFTRCHDCARPVYSSQVRVIVGCTTEKVACATCNSCNRCCSCSMCDSCDNLFRVGMIHDACGRCVHVCCECVRCQACGNFAADGNICDNGHCRRCCQCQPMIAFFNPEVDAFKPARKGQHKINPSSRYISMEIEVSNVARGSNLGNFINTVKNWGGGVVRDGSLPATGFEINTAPASGDVFVEQVKSICEELKNVQAKVNAQCGLHVHVDARDYSYYDVRRLVKLYANIEDPLYRLLSPARRSSRFCIPCGQGYLFNIKSNNYKELKRSLTKNIYGRGSTRDVRKSKYNDARYKALNLHSWFYRGSIECRMFSGTIRQDKIVPWGILWAGLLDAAAKMSDAEVDEMIAKNTGDANFELLLAVCPNAYVRNWVLNRRDKFEDGE